MVTMDSVQQELWLGGAGRLTNQNPGFISPNQSQRRTRTCSQPMPMNGGRECSGDRFQNNKCMLRRCPWAKKGNLDDEEDTTEEVATEVTTTSKPKPRVTCPQPPFVSGFLDPQILNMIAVTEIHPGTRISYKCR